jgi:hypothetical protein
MNATGLLARLRAKGLTVAAHGDALTVRPRELLTDELRAAIRANKPAILAELRGRKEEQAAVVTGGARPHVQLSDAVPRYRWLILESDGRRREIVTLPEMTAAELAPCYPGARLLPLPDAVGDPAAKNVAERDFGDGDPAAG